MGNPPKVFISYCWTSEAYKAFVLNLAKKLRSDGIDVILDQWDLRPGHDMFAFMEQSIIQSDKVLILCDKAYAAKADAREGGVGNETTIITPDVYGHHKQEKFIPVIVESFDSIPSYLRSRLGIDFRAARRNEGYQELLRTIFNKHVIIKPELGKPPKWLDSATYYFNHPIVMKVGEDFIRSPVAGTIIPQDQIPDEIFSSGILGAGIGIRPSSGVIVAPVDGEITAVADAKHAIGIASDSGLEFLIHAGIDTVALSGYGFSLKVVEGKKVKKGDLLLEFDRDKIRKAGHSDMVVFLLTNSDDYDVNILA